MGRDFSFAIQSAGMVSASLFILAGWAFAVCLALAGRYLSRRRRYTYCLVMGGVACIFMPFGTVLGVFTIITLVRDSVKRLFRRDDGAGSPARGGETPPAPAGG